MHASTAARAASLPSFAARTSSPASGAARRLQPCARPQRRQTVTRAPFFSGRGRLSLVWQRKSITTVPASLRLEVGAEAASRSTPRVQVERAQGFNARQLFASVEINAPPETVWNALTSYASLQDFIPGLKENTVIEQRRNGVLLEQVGEEDIAIGVKFTAKVLLEIKEYPRGVPADRLTDSGEIAPGKLPKPRCPWGQPSINYRDISFELQEGDFNVFNGIWRIQSGASGLSSCRLSYSVIVKPKPWLPVRLVESRIKGEIAANLMAVREFAEAQSKGNKRTGKEVTAAVTQ
mmetsp:Transcript_39062/g.110643  ORF Transcript_39062/g.110643 Transcript_39062/m.110643 type:complete len:293 (-) Transcript_39062:507-1385(-)